MSDMYKGSGGGGRYDQKKNSEYGGAMSYGNGESVIRMVVMSMIEEVVVIIIGKGRWWK